MWNCSNLCMDNEIHKWRFGGICRPDFTRSFAARKLMPYPAGLSACYPPLLCCSLYPLSGLEWSKITRVLVEKKQEGGNIFLTTLATRVCPVLKLPDTRPLAGDLKKVEFTATTNGLNSQLSLDKLKTNSCSLSKKRGGQLFPSGQTVTGNHSLQQYKI